ncbi:hypothetical protein CKO35_01045 [Ectothiorhodospira shaposhnikovii]|uniref:hypothetical protein n=1 Tax=Ectothiorhodospira shaposhnikovii TaxID=1054 RepID=UPI0019033F06|nr:hypothetical protein [Ectothiorhodospira shaposhnikovii]MBK1671902.1 hypothetical protein [Ectothiorhodospira shaposhnikovii]
MVFPTASVPFRYLVTVLRLAVLSMLLLFTGAAQAQPILSILPESTGCVSVLTSQAGGLYRACGPDWRFRRIAGVPEALPVALTESNRSLILGTRTGLYQRSSDQAGWQRLSDQPTGALACHGARCVVRPFGQGPHRLSDGRLSPLRVRGLPDQPLQQFVIAGEGVLYGAGMGAGVLQLRPGDDAWQPVGSGLGNGNVLALALANDGTLHVGTYGGGLYCLRPGEDRWQRLSGLQATRVTALAVSADGSWLLAGVGDGVRESRDGGDSWREVPELAGIPVLSLAFDEVGRAWAGTREGQLYRRQGEAWMRVRFGDDLSVHQVTADGRGGLFALIGERLYRRPYPGADWQRIETPFPLADGWISLAMDGAGRLYLGSPRHPTRRLDIQSGQWPVSVSGLPEPGSFRVLRRGPEGVVYGIHADTGQLYRLEPERDHWTLIEVGEARLRHQVWDLRRLPGEHGVAWGPNILMWQRPGEPWQHNWFAQLERGAPGLDADRVLWTRRQVTVFSLAPGENRWSDNTIRHPLYVEAVALADGTEVALTGDNRLVRLLRREDGTWAELDAHVPPGPPPYTLAAAGDRVYLGTLDGLHELDRVHGTWRDITPTH